MARKETGRKWSQKVMETSDALDLEENIFKSEDPRRIARSLKRSALASRRRKSTPFRSAMSMLTFYINRAGRNLPASRRRTLEAAKGALREVFGREPAPGPHARSRQRSARPAQGAKTTDSSSSSSR